ncbi:ATP-binding protein [Paracoccus denitrificans]|jgi:3-methylcrotonyl-CoA carboxylase alpha subunit|uniref:3-methylcrotonoyl-CoA carboxylase, alpha subunit n=1 Tax=Paracoccus denitrificans (strain Pd 1222) TaxID=318586 RepID=A1B862_PARDP|nr:biotin carboxylase N-terminal domain-containing protein [Paracoccus denitrificans]ABL71706.1 3-methylcrotonoyl-CoA carboxylase, alpha subunit [Paracoccus denitrificans PD1222]MBB4629345.1 3-methylcrotonyl-CoA carboxylase alpha subunit [Paracoccus denitrificans]MCU7430510.1 ATP-grasp domain-containing protein [Paracoccus denitrificans]QAR28296.1 ATP-grasp domain-containing protein [Paracoccus denitrificans]UPV98035.1 ATP-grasp domain-containing protein [Paracoccus denitrificans]
MFQKILIANRGEIACRVIDTARKLGVRTVAVYSEADRAARHVTIADEAVPIGGPAPKDSYLRGDAIIRAALDTGAQAIHPGYGFLSENPDFVDAVTAAGLTFIGPSADAIRKMGLKDAAKALMAEAGVPVVPGYHGENQDAGHLAAQADKIGYPVLIKAVAGGGGKGMRLVERAGDFAAALQSAQGEAATAFGNPAVLVEKYIQQPRHIEVQVFGDGHRAVHLFERDCSLQRRHQKVIEEAPAPGMTPEMRAAMGAAAVRAAEAIGYAGAGTIEFIVDGSRGLRSDGFWFMEMNTRLQVEHPVTELVTGVDLVEWQLRVASGEPLPARQEDLAITGHAFEARLYAEDVPAGFLPATGRLAHLRFPDHARIETGVRPGDAISPWYDPMIAKIVTHGATRAIALRALEAALVDTEVAGSVTNVDFLIALARHEGFGKGEVDTGLIARDLQALIAAAEPDPRAKALAVLGLAGLDDPMVRGGITLWQPLSRTIAWEGGEAVLEVLGPGAARVTLDGSSHEIAYEGGRWWVDGSPRRSRIVNHAAGTSVFGGRSLTLAPLDPLARGGEEAGGGMTLSPMPGLVKAIFVEPGQEVAAGARLAILEAMKMEHTLTAARDGRVAEVFARAGDQVEAGAALIRLEEEGDA